MTAGKSGKRLSLYPLKFDEVISDVLKMKPEPPQAKKKARRTAAHTSSKSSKNY